MPVIFRARLLFFLMLASSPHLSAQTISNSSDVATDAEIALTLDEIRYIYERAPKQIQSQASNDASARYELIANAIASKRILKNLQDVGPDNEDLYVAFRFEVLAAARKFDERRFQRELNVPDLDALAQEQWRVSRSEIATVPEKRSLSHILLLCSEGCDEDEKTAKLGDIRQRIADGESFSDLALEFSQDPGSKQRGGRLSRSISLADENVDQTFRDTAFTLTEVGEISEIVQSRFGFHIMRLEAIEPEREYTFEEVKAPLMAEIEKRYREDAYRDYVLSMGPTEALRIDEEAIDSIMGKLPEVEEVATPAE
jgi:parvulin-like peptidyl-prolyl isomerase